MENNERYKVHYINYIYLFLDTENAITLGTKIGQLILLCYNSFKEVKT
jgi:hypothetical protein